MSINRWTDKQIKVQAYNGILLNDKKCITPIHNKLKKVSKTLRSEINQIQKDKYYMIPLIWGI